MERTPLRLRLVGIGAMASPRFAPAGLVIEAHAGVVLLDGGPESAPPAPAAPLAAWLVTDVHAELIAGIRRAAREAGLTPRVAEYAAGGLLVEPLPVQHTSHPTWGYRIRWAGRTAVWAPEFATFPAWAAGADLMFADAAGWSRPIRFRGGVGGHAAVLDTARAARDARVGRLVFAHLGRPTIRALDAGDSPPFGEIGIEGADYEL